MLATLVFVLAMQAVAQIDVPTRPPTPLEQVPNVTVIPYEIRGDLAPDLRRAMDELGPMMSNGVRVPVRTQWRNQVRWSNDANGCLPQTARMTWQIETTAPVIAADAEAGPRMRARFDRYRQQLDAFEYGRAQRINAGMEATLAAMRAAADCDALVEARRAGEAGIVEANRDYDLATARARRNMRPLQ